VEIKFEQIQEIIPRCKDIAKWNVLLNTYLPPAGIITPEQVARFISQTAHESADYSILVENLNYSEPGLLSTFGKYFSAGVAKTYARQPEKIANRVYANRMGNDDEASGDGWNFRGRGIIQITGKNNYAACSQSIFGNDRLVQSPNDLLDPINAVRSGIWYWTSNRLLDISDMTLLTKKINGGLVGLAERIAKYDHAISVLKTQ
jgi:putative chitinase